MAVVERHAITGGDTRSTIISGAITFIVFALVYVPLAAVVKAVDLVFII